MLNARIDSLARVLDARSRRRLLGAVSGAVVMGPLALMPTADAKRRGKKKARPKCPLCPSAPGPPPVLTCAQACPAACSICLARPGIGTACGGARITDCSAAGACTSDNDCFENAAGRPYCVSHFIDQNTEAVSDICPTGPGAFCTSIVRCF
jgi:hypothetical protein